MSSRPHSRRAPVGPDILQHSVAIWFLFAALGAVPAPVKHNPAGDSPVPAPRRLPTADFSQFAPALRQKVDAQALACPNASPLAKDGPFFGELAGWIVSRAPLSLEEETRRAERAVTELERRFDTANPPRRASAVLESLITELPDRLRAAPLEFSLRTIDAPQWIAFTSGGGRLFVS